MAYILLFLIIVNTSLSFAIVFKKQIEETIIFTVFSYIVILFITGTFINNMVVGFYLILVINILLFIYNIYEIIKKKVNFKEQIITSGFIIFILSYLLILWISIGRKASEWDEFSHWMLIVKNMYNLGTLGIGSESTTIAQNYLSGSSIFQFFCTKLSMGFNEGLCYTGMNIMNLAFIIPIFKILKKKNFFLISILFGILFFIPMIFYNLIYTSVYVDGILGLAFAYSIYSYFYNKELNLFNTLVALCMLVFIKEFGFVLACGVILIFFIDSLFVKNKFKFNIKFIWENSKKLLFVLVSIIFIKIVWNIYLINIIGNNNAGTSHIIETIKNLITGNILPYQKEFLTNYSKALYEQNLSYINKINLSFSNCICIAIFLGYFIIANTSEEIEKKRMINLIICSILGAFAYATLLIVVPYLGVFIEYEAVRLASYQRYMSTYIFGLLYMELALIVYVLKDKRELYKFIMIFFIIFIFNFNQADIIKTTFGARNENKKTIQTRSDYQKFINLTNNFVGKDEKIYFIATNTNGFEYYIARYELTPKKMNAGVSWSIGNPYYEGDIWTKKETIEEWKKELINESYKYVYLYKVDENFIEIFGDLFQNEDIKNNQIYKVNSNLNPNCILELVAE